ncbi:MAG: bifunctional UDP-3-O-[3-hydroxymyristoyl] N-acetylglucosamine deacetylase/3-hydroxyacyl-ACP dehydratase [Gemmatimonadales bacterium]|nr:MAG: bifunctional UDP-3-O-[3-hydroxymyristoyl] N-acetylglucosamine deacetylase/3-hydroxyacyl-ACP dehydratase [Gemmatimonadales bacterium]
MIGSKQATLVERVRLSGVGVHSGTEATLTLVPAPECTGIVFQRTDLEGSPRIPANLDHVSDTELGTTLALPDGSAKVMTVEHLMAALAAAGISNVVVEIDGPEPPILDGSFGPYLAAIQAAGVEVQEADLPVIRIRRPVTASGSQGSSYVATSASDYRISATIDFSHSTIGRQYGSFEVGRDVFRDQLAPARTFGFRAQAEALRERGLAQGSSLENTVVLDDDGVMNDGLRFPDEFLRHKVGDMVGDLALLGARLEGHIVADRPSHEGNIALARAIVEDQRRSPEGEAIVDTKQILQYLPHRYPMLLVDRITHFESGKRIVGIKNVTVNEPFFQGHYPGHPIMPGVLIIEAMAQVGGLLLMDTIENPDQKVVYFMSLDRVKWRRPVTPGDQLVFQLELLQFRRSVCKMRGEGFVDGKLVAEAELMARVMDR